MFSNQGGVDLKVHAPKCVIESCPGARHFFRGAGMISKIDGTSSIFFLKSKLKDVKSSKIRVLAAAETGKMMISGAQHKNVP